MVLKSQVSQQLMWGEGKEMVLQAKALATKPDCGVPESSADGRETDGRKQEGNQLSMT